MYVSGNCNGGNSVSVCGCGVSGRRVVGTGGDEVGDFVEGADAAASADGGAVQCCGRAGEFELAVEWPVLEERVDETGVKDVAGACGVDYWDAEGGNVEELLAVKGENALLAEGGGGEAAVVAALHFSECLLKIGLGGETGGKVAGDDEVVDVVDEGFDVGIELVEVGDDGDVGFAGPGGGKDGGFGVVAVDMECAGVDDPFAIEVGGAEGEAGIGVTSDEDCALALRIDEDEGLSAGSAGDGENTGFDA